ncbi:hypothetical protein DPMN_172577 [Dreissena polymorpha]|uniref:Uncharacterized protein n=1 Tax=Dreissena polymorpha TaxID=45954 RepID=A0A9D4E027_DREPO|nr:hypothetical protein DPMN_172577 [Dreissena polymorpha]
MFDGLPVLVAVAVCVEVLGYRVVVSKDVAGTGYLPSYTTTLVDLQRCAICPYMMEAEKFSDTTGKSYNTKREFYRKCSLPNIMGAIDGTLVPIVAPTENEEVYVCRKGFHALNCQAVSSPDLK